MQNIPTITYNVFFVHTCLRKQNKIKQNKRNKQTLQPLTQMQFVWVFLCLHTIMEKPKLDTYKTCSQNPITKRPSFSAVVHFLLIWLCWKSGGCLFATNNTTPSIKKKMSMCYWTQRVLVNVCLESNAIVVRILLCVNSVHFICSNDTACRYRFTSFVLLRSGLLRHAMLFSHSPR